MRDWVREFKTKKKEKKDIFVGYRLVLNKNCSLTSVSKCGVNRVAAVVETAAAV